MADENPTPSAAPSDDPDKKETIRITLPPKRRDSCRQARDGACESHRHRRHHAEEGNVKGDAADFRARDSAADRTAFRAARAAATFKPVSGLTPPPKPPSFVSKPTIPLKPAPSGVVPKPVPGLSGIAAKPASPKRRPRALACPRMRRRVPRPRFRRPP